MLAGSAALGFAHAAAAAATPAQPRNVARALALGGSPFAIGCDMRGITTLKYRGDRFDTDYIAVGEALRDVGIAWRRQGGDWRRSDSATALVRP